jgi:hypothetical protein
MVFAGMAMVTHIAAADTAVPMAITGAIADTDERGYEQTHDDRCRGAEIGVTRYTVALSHGDADQLSIPCTLLTRASQRRYNQPNIAIDTTAKYASLPNVALHEERKPA